MRSAEYGVTVAVTALSLLVGTSAPAATVIDGHRSAQAWRLEDAVEAARAVLAGNPDDPEAWLLAARVQHMRGEHLSALPLVAAAETAGVGGGTGLHRRVLESARYAAHFETHQTEHFSIRYLNKDVIVATYAGPVLEAAYRNIAGDLEFLPAEEGERIVVEIYPDARGLAGATGLTVSEIETSGTIAVCKFHRLMIISPLAAANGYSWGDTLAHEFVHLVISKKSKNTVPIWLHEGIAKFYESRWKGELGEGMSPYAEKLLADAVRANDFITYEQMHPSMAKLPSQEAAALAFAEVFTTIEFLVKRYGKESIARVLDLSADGVDLDAALRKVYGMGLAGIEQAWKRYLKKRPFAEVAGAAPKRVQLTGDETEAAGERPLESIEDREVHDRARLGELLQLRGHHRAAVVEYEKAYARAGVRYATVVGRLARAYDETQRPSDALKVLEATLAAHPEYSDGHLLAGRIRLAQKGYHRAQQHFEAVRLQNPFNPEIHRALGQLYAARGDKARADMETRFLSLTKKPRPTRKYELPSPQTGAARVSLVTRDWTPVRVDEGEPLTTPLWDHAIAAGEHTVEYLREGGSPAILTFAISAGDRKTIVLE